MKMTTPPIRYGAASPELKSPKTNLAKVYSKPRPEQTIERNRGNPQNIPKNPITIEATRSTNKGIKTTIVKRKK